MDDAIENTIRSNYECYKPSKFHGSEKGQVLSAIRFPQLFLVFNSMELETIYNIVVVYMV